MKSFSSLKKQWVKDPKVKEAYDDLDPEFAFVQMIIEVRLKKGLTQKELAEKMGTKQSAISRLERGVANPSLHFLRKWAEALGVELVFAVRER